MQGFRGLSDLSFWTLDNFSYLFLGGGGVEREKVLHENVHRTFLDVLDGPQRPGTIIRIINNC